MIAFQYQDVTVQATEKLLVAPLRAFEERCKEITDLKKQLYVARGNQKASPRPSQAARPRGSPASVRSTQPKGRRTASALAQLRAMQTPSPRGTACP